MQRFIVLSVVAIATLVRSFAASSDVVISEFMASNTSGIKDEDNTYPDWIELRNTTATNVNLGGWYLTDASGNLTKWRIPSTNLAGGSFLIVFADGKNRAVPGAPLHTSFNLSASGEYLALVRPDLSIATQFSPVYGPQAPNVSYGFGSLATNYTVLATNATNIRWRIPNGTEGANWNGTNYNDSAWAIGTNGFGYGPTNGTAADYSVAVLPTAPVVYYRLDESSGTSAANLGSGAAMNGTYTSATLGTAGPRPASGFNGFESGNNAPTFNGSSSLVAGPNGFFNGRNSFTVGGWIYPTATPPARTGLFGQNDCVEFGFVSGTGLELWTPGGGSVTGIPYPFGLNSWHHIVGVGDGTTVRIYIDGQLAGTGGTATANYGSSAFNFNIGGGGVQDATGNFFTGQIDEVVAYHRALSAAEVLALFQAGTNGAGISTLAYTRTDVGPAMSNVNASAYLRVPFTVTEPTNVTAISLRMRYDDGFVAYLNGTELVRAGAADPLVFNSAATNAHAPTSVTEFRPGVSGLMAGTNILAIQALNLSSNDIDFLILPEMVLTVSAGEIPTPVYFTAPTPGTNNVGGIANPGPILTDDSHTPNVPRDDQDLLVTVKAAPSFQPVSTLVLRYRVMFGSEVEVPMYDDGQHGDGGTNDGVYAATIPSSAAANGQMMRWYFVATDIDGNSSRLPIFATPTQTAEYFGTIVEPTNVTSKLPIIHLFAPATVLQPGPTTAQTGADSQAGAQVSLFYDGEFYDNIRMELRGNSTAGFNKKSHRVDFNREHPFRHKPGYPRVRKTSFTADWPDPTYMRQAITFWMANQFGAPAPFYYPVRLQLNGAFYQLANHNDVQGDEFLERLGFDPNGALYNAAGTVVPSKFSTGGFDKKTRTWQNDADYTNLTTRIAESVTTALRYTNVMDLFDVPEALNYLTVARWSHENDDVWANMSLYHDNDGDSLWRILPFDMNLSWGAIFAEGTADLYTGVQATNDTHKSHPLYGGSTILARSSGNYNRVYDTFFQVPELRQMFLRRMRTLLDTFIKGIGTPTNSTALETMILTNRDYIAEEAIRDRAWWGWPGVGGQNNFNPGINITNGVNDMLEQFVRARRNHFYGRHLVTNTALSLYNGAINPGSNTCAGIPLGQASNLVLRVNQIEAMPGTGNQGHEYIQITNPNPAAVDISGWKLDGAVDFTFAPGTIVLSNSVIYVVPDLKVFRTRLTTPRTNQALLVVGPYQGSLDARGEIVQLLDDTARLVHTNGYTPAPSLAQQYLRITEIMYHPAPSNASCAFAQEEFEYIELKNIGPTNLNLVGVHFTNGIEFAFTSAAAVTNLAPGQTVVLVRNIAAFNCRYGSATIAGIFSNSLDNAGERIKLNDVVGEQILDFSYNNTWYPITDGLGFSLVIVNENAPWNTWDEKASWRASGNQGGSPGVTDPAPAVIAPVVVNEVLANSEWPDVDAIELWNSGTNTANIGGWFISDDFFTPRKFRITDGTSLNPGDFITFNETHFNAGTNATNFAFSSLGDEAYLFAADASGNLLGYYHGFHLGPSGAGVTVGRYLDSQSAQHVVAQAGNTLGGANSLPLVGPVVVSEIMYHPPDSTNGDDTVSEFIELLNISTNAVSLFDATAPTNCWKLKDAVDFVFPTNTVLAAGQFALVVSFDPQTNAAALAAFRARWGVDTNVTLFGPYSGQLDNSADNVELAMPQPWSSNGWAYVLVDKVDYRDSAPWNAIADGIGLSLQRVVPADFGNDATNWAAAAVTPGSGLVLGDVPVITQHPTNLVALAGASATLAVTATGSNLLYQWRFNGASIAGATNATLNFASIQSAQAGTYSVAVWNTSGGGISSNAAVTVLLPVFITAQPLSQTGPSGTNVTMSVAAVGNGTLRYQWFFNSNAVAGATNSSLPVLNAQLPQHGYYMVRVTDDISTVDSIPALLYVLVKAGIHSHPQNMTVVQGANVTVSGVVTGAWPISLRWFVNNVTTTNLVATNFPLNVAFVRGGTNWMNVTMSTISTSCFSTITMTNLQANATFRMVSTNLASGGVNVQSTTATITVLKDSDGDGVPDVWEAAHGMITNNAADGLLDFDNDGMINRDEYFAGTSPTNAASVLKVFLTQTNLAAPLQFDAQSNITYTIQYRTNFDAAPWQTLSNVAPQAGVRTILFASPPETTNNPRYFRVLVPPTP
jgi:hypothetical protein